MEGAPVLFVDHAPALGGAEHSLLMLLERLDRRRLAPRLACTGGPLAQQAESLGIPVHAVALPRLRRSPGAPADWWRGARELAEVGRSTGARAIVANTVRAAVFAAPAARLAGIPLVWYMRDFWLSETRPLHPWLDRLAKRLLCAASARVVANSQATASHLPCRRKTIAILNGIDLGRFHPGQDGLPFRQQFGIPPEALLAGTVGRLRPWKGQEAFLRAMAPVVSRMPGAYLAVVGGDNFAVEERYARHLRRLAADLGLAGRVAFTGHLDDVRPALAAMDVFVAAGEPEPFGLVNVEAMAMGVPVVGYAHGALPEIVADGATGQLVAPGDELALGEAVAALLRAPERRLTMAVSARQRAVSCFAIERTVEQVSALLETVLH